ncbi:MAG: class I SAM-dependent RNA methyltransferase [Methylibium sp.]|uniref:THUMP domain-containing class I SAM-dependent RNA methyltransferase n=1 Tax=Methylibium sp. TaxID=2067992 RepID=UPI0017D8A179|nr:THUMP domain-containing protein [Methylibium sp.]MBA3599576.1 class I SAM-dependent RNA methyltransferase [Methylibium sp.]
MSGAGTQLFLPCAAGVEALLAAEVQRLLPEAAPQTQRGGVALPGGVSEAMALNLGSRLAQRVLWRVAEGGYRSEDDLYDLARTVPWGDWLTPTQTLKVDVTAQRAPLKSLNFAGLRIKDGVCDAMRDALGERPSVDIRHPDLPLLLHLTADQATLYVDTSGESLFKRGWREDQGEAPLKETLAAAMLAAAGWQGREEDGPLLDPVCGSGTIAIEAAQIACGIAPGALRRFTFGRLGPFRDAATQRTWRDLRDAAQAAQHASAVPIFAGDVSFRMTDFAARNAERAGVRGAIELKTVDALQRTAPAATGTMLLNPPYGERIEPKGSRGEPVQGHRSRGEPAQRGRPGGGAGQDSRARGNDGNGEAGARAPLAREGFEGGATANEFFSRLAAHWKGDYAGWTAWVLSPDMKLPQAMRLKESQRVPLWNGPIECRLFRFDMVAGSMRGAGDGSERASKD